MNDYIDWTVSDDMHWSDNFRVYKQVDGKLGLLFTTNSRNEAVVAMENYRMDEPEVRLVVIERTMKVIAEYFPMSREVVFSTTAAVTSINRAPLFGRLGRFFARIFSPQQ